LPEKFVKKWGERWKYQPPFGIRIKEAVRPPGPLKPRLDFAVRRIEVQIQRLDQESRFIRTHLNMATFITITRFSRIILGSTLRPS